MIESYDFGKIRIDGGNYDHDVIIFSDGVNSWSREESHLVGVGDIKEIVEKKPKTVIFGTGTSGIMKIAEETKEYLENLNIEIIIEPTKKACDIYNKLSEKQGVIAALHLTC